MTPQLDGTHYADEETLYRLNRLERENKALRALLRECVPYVEHCPTIMQRIRAALREEE